MPRVDSYSSLTPAWGKSCLLQLHLLHLVDLLLLVNGFPRGQLLVVGSRVEHLVHLASCVQLLVVGPRVGQLVLRCGCHVEVFHVPTCSFHSPPVNLMAARWLGEVPVVSS